MPKYDEIEIVDVKRIHIYLSYGQLAHALNHALLSTLLQKSQVCVKNPSRLSAMPTY